MKTLRKAVAAALAAVLAGLAPGLPFYSALAQQVPVANAPVGTPVSVPVVRVGIAPAVDGGSIGLDAGFGGTLTGAPSITGAPAAETGVAALEAPALREGRPSASALREDGLRLDVPAGRIAAAALESAPAPRSGDQAAGQGAPQDERPVLERLAKAPSLASFAPRNVPLDQAAAMAADDFRYLALGGPAARGDGAVRAEALATAAHQQRGPPPAETTWPATRGQGRVDAGNGFLPHELRLARYLAGQGHNVRALPEDRSDGRRRHADAQIDGVRVEFKSRMPEEAPAERRRHRTDHKWIEHVVRHSLHHGGQARVLVLDARGSDLHRDQVTFAVGRMADVFGRRIDSLRVVGDGFDVAFGRWPGRPASPASTAAVSDGASGGNRGGRGPTPPPLPAGVLDLKDYRYTQAGNVQLALRRAAHIGFYVAAFGVYALGLGLPAFLAPVIAAATLVARIAKAARQEASAPVADNPGTARPEHRRQWDAAVATFDLILDRLQVPVERTPRVHVTDEHGALNSINTGRGFDRRSNLIVGTLMAEMPSHQLAGVLAHESGHMFLGDNTASRVLRAKSHTFGFLRNFYLVSGAVALALDLAAGGVLTSLGMDVSALVPSIGLILLSAPLALAGYVAGLALGREEERRADHFSAWATHPLWMAEFLERNIGGDERPSGAWAAVEEYVYYLLYRVHPRVPERIARLKAMAGEAHRPRGPPTPPAPPVAGSDSGPASTAAFGFFNRGPKAPAPLPVLHPVRSIARAGSDWQVNGKPAARLGSGDFKTALIHPADPLLTVKVFRNTGYRDHDSLTEKRREHRNIMALEPYGVVPRLVEQGAAQVGDEGLGFIVQQRVVAVSTLEIVTPTKLKLVRELFDRLIEAGAELDDTGRSKLEQNILMGTTDSDRTIRAYLVDADVYFGRMDRKQLISHYAALYAELESSLGAPRR